MIHHFDGSHWQPGPDHRDGSRPFPAHPHAGLCFNDVTGAAGASPAAVAEGLPHLMMKQALLIDLLPTPFHWRGLMERIEAAAASVPELTRSVATATVLRDESLQVHPAPGWNEAVARDACAFALALVRAQGQMDYLRRQPWYRDDRHGVVLVVETEFGRQSDELKWHKDTEGDALFSNLVFRNNPGLPATEWSLDLQPMPPDKRAVLARNWPPALLHELDEARRQLAQTPAGAMTIEGGTLPSDGAVSWVDELVWHSSPVLAHRSRHTLDDVMATLASAAFTQDAYDILAQIAQTPGSRFSHWLHERAQPLETLDLALARQLWADMHGAAGVQDLVDLLRQDAQAIDWTERPRQTAWGISLIQPSPDSDAQRLTLQPTGLLGRPRSNSGQLQAMTSHPSSHQMRDFLQVIVAVRPRH